MKTNSSAEFLSGNNSVLTVAAPGSPLTTWSASGTHNLSLQVRGVAALPGERFVATSGHESSTIGVYGADGLVVGSVQTAAKRGKGMWPQYSLCAASPSGALVAAVTGDTRQSVSVWTLDALINGGKPKVYKVPSANVCFTPDEKSLVSLAGDQIVVTPLGQGRQRAFDAPIGVLLHTSSRVQLSAGGELICLSNGTGTSALMTLGGKLVGTWSLDDAFPVEQLAVTQEGLVIAASGALDDHFLPATTAGLKLKFPAPKMKDGFVAQVDAKGKFGKWFTPKKNKQVYGLAAIPGLAVVLGHVNGAQPIAWPVGW